jgi:beta-mannosidase
LVDRQLKLDIQYYDLNSTWRSQETHAVNLLSNQSTELVSKTCPHRPQKEDELVTPSSSVIVYARLIDSSTGTVVARYADWPQPFRYIDFPDPEIQITRLTSEGKAGRIEISVQRPAKCVVLSDRKYTISGNYGEEDSWCERIKWNDNALDLYPNDNRILECSGLVDSAEIWVACMGHEKAFKVV